MTDPSGKETPRQHSYDKCGTLGCPACRAHNAAPSVQQESKETRCPRCLAKLTAGYCPVCGFKVSDAAPSVGPTEHVCKFPIPAPGWCFPCEECGTMWQWDEVSQEWESVGEIESESPSVGTAPTPTKRYLRCRRCGYSYEGWSIPPKRCPNIGCGKLEEYIDGKWIVVAGAATGETAEQEAFKWLCGQGLVSVADIPKLLARYARSRLAEVEAERDALKAKIEADERDVASVLGEEGDEFVCGQNVKHRVRHNICFYCWAEKAEAENERLRSALERTLQNFKLILAQKSVRDASETIAEAEAALRTF